MRDEAVVKQERKLRSLKGEINSVNVTQKSNVVNLSKLPLDEDSQKVLEYGLNFAIAPSKIPVKNLICSIESAVDGLPEDAAEEIRQECAVIIRRAKPPKLNISCAERKALQNLRRNNQIKIVKADKGNTTVILDTDEYVRKMNDHLACGSYRKLTKDPGIAMCRSVTKAIKDSNIEDSIKKKLYPSPYQNLVVK